MKTPKEFISEYYQLPQSKIETVRIKSLIRCLERYKEYYESEVKKLNIPVVSKSVCPHCGAKNSVVDILFGKMCEKCEKII